MKHVVNYLCLLLGLIPSLALSADNCQKYYSFAVPIEASEQKILQDYRDAREPPNPLAKIIGWAPTPHSLRVRGKDYKIVETLGGGDQGVFYRGINEAGVSFALKQDEADLRQSSHYALVAAHEEGIPTIIDESTQYDLQSRTGRYRYHLGVSVSEIEKNLNFPEPLRKKVSEWFARWKTKYCEGKKRSNCTARNVLFDFDTHTFFLFDSF